MKAWFGSKLIVEMEEEYKTICLANDFLERWCDRGPIHYLSKNHAGSIAASDQDKDDREIVRPVV